MYKMSFTKTHEIAERYTYGRQESQPCQIRCTAGERYAQPSTRRGDPRAFPKQRFLRLQRFSSGQVRDAAPSRRREGIGEPNSDCVWFFTPFFLPGPISLCLSRDGWLVAPEARPTPSAQTHFRGPAVCAAVPTRRSDAAKRTSRPTGSRVLWHLCASSDYRAGVGSTPKKTSLRDSDYSAVPITQHSGFWRVRYEELRSQALGGESKGRGLTLFLRQGMKAWLQSSYNGQVSADCGESPRESQPEVGGPSWRLEIVFLLAGMALETGAGKR